MEQKNKESQNLRDGLLKELSEKLSRSKQGETKEFNFNKNTSISSQLSELSKAIRKESVQENIHKKISMFQQMSLSR